MRLLFSFLLFTFYFASTAQIPSYVPTNGLVGYWPFNGNANDESGNGNNGVVNGATLTSDRFGNVGKALSFDGMSNYVEVPHSSTFNFTNKITISLWIKPNTIFAPGVESYVLNKQSNYGASQVGFHIYYWYNSSLGSMITFRCRNGNNSNWGGCSYNSLSPFTNTWKNFILAYDSVSMRIYIDGQFFTSSSPENLGYNNASILIGKFISGGYFKGDIDDIAIYNRALNSQEITQLYRSTVTPSNPEDTTSNVGIGTTTPKRKLHVNDVMRLEPRDTAPTNPAKGDIYFDGVLNKLRVYDGSVWQSCW